MSADERTDSTWRRVRETLVERWRSAAAAGLWFALTVLILAPSYELIEDQPGALVEADIRAPVPIDGIIDSDAFRAEQARIRAEHDQVWTFLPGVRSGARDRLRICFSTLGEQEPETGSDIVRISEKIADRASIRISTAEVETLYRRVPDLRRFESRLLAIADVTLGSKLIVADEGLFAAHQRAGLLKLERLPEEITTRGAELESLGWPSSTRSYLEQEMREYYPDADSRELVKLGRDILMETFAPNIRRNLEESEQLRDTLLAETERARTGGAWSVEWNKGDLIARAGDHLSSTQASALAEANARLHAAYPFRWAGIAVLTLFCFSVTGFYLMSLRKDLRFTASNITMVSLPLMIALGAGRLFVFLEADGGMLAAVFPAAVVGLLATILIGPSAGFILVLISGVLFGVATGQPLEFQVVSLFGGFAAVVSLKELRERKDIIAAGFKVGLVNVATVCLLALFEIPPAVDWRLLALAFTNGLACAAAALPLLVIFERAFGIVTDIRLLELTSPHHPLIRMMEEKSPGSYQHVLNVTKLAESAAEAIGANYLLVRAGAYFHDIGKMLKPKYFSENQVTLDDKKAHSKLSPYMSVLIIKNHVKEGIELGRKYSLPEKVVDFIPQHHGTSTIKYFYTEALKRYEESETTDIVREEDFRYPGPPPQSIETAIVMLADSVEAIATSVFTGSQVNENDLRRTVAQAVTERFNDGQFDECDLTMRDLFQIRESFVKTLKARFHHRIAYPSQPSRRDAVREAAQPALVPLASAQE